MSTTRDRTPLAPRSLNGRRDLAIGATARWGTLQGRPAWTDLLDTLQVGPSILPSKAFNIDIGASNSFTPILDNAYNLGQHGLVWRNTWCSRVVTDDVAARGVEVILGGLDLADGSTVPWWRVKEAAMIPDGVRDIGSACNQVNHIFACNITIDREAVATRPWVIYNLPTWDALSNKPEWSADLELSNVGPLCPPGGN